MVLLVCNNCSVHRDFDCMFHKKRNNFHDTALHYYFSHIPFQRFVSVLDFETDLIVTPQYKVCLV